MTVERLQRSVKRLHDFVAMKPPNTMVISYYDYTRPDMLARMFGIHDGTVPSVQVPYSDSWGDPFPKHRTVRHITEAEDVARATHELGDDAPDLTAAIALYAQLRAMTTVNSQT